MDLKGRTEKSLMNVLTGVFGQFFSYLLSFAIRTVFIKTLGEVYLGLNGLYSNILSVLNLTELGLGTAIVIELYRTVGEKNDEKTKEYLILYKKAYQVIGTIILLAGLALVPFLDRFVKDKDSLVLINYRIVFVLYLINTVFSYYFFAYRQSILQADQAEYKARIITYSFKLVEMVLQIICLFLFKNIYVYLIIPILLGCISTVVKGVLIGKWYPIVKEQPESKLSKAEVKSTWRNIFSVAVYKISGTVINSTDNIIISTYVSLVLTGIYSNYLVLLGAVQTILEKVFSAFTASLGNLNVEAADDTEKKYQVFSTMWFLNFWLYGFCAVCMFVLFEPFVKLWLGERFLLGTATEFVIVLNFLVMGLQQTIGIHRAAYGLFYKGRFRPVFSVLVNIIASLALVNALPDEYGVVAVLLGTIVSTVSVSWWFDTWVVFKNAFQKKPFQYYGTYLLRMLFLVIECIIIKWICHYTQTTPVADLLLYGTICVFVYNLSFFAIFCRSDECREMLSLFKRMIMKIVKKRGEASNAGP